MTRNVRIGPAQRRALMLAYSDGHNMYVDSDPEFGVNPRTARSLLERGLLQVERDGDDEYADETWSITRDGEKALGAWVPASRRPKRLKTATRRALATFADEGESLRRAILRPDELGRQVWTSDERLADYGEAMAVIDLEEYEFEMDDVAWGCVGRMVSELGFPCYVEAGHGVAGIWADGE
jgi:hypothetical protein